MTDQLPPSAAKKGLIPMSAETMKDWELAQLAHKAAMDDLRDLIAGRRKPPAEPRPNRAQRRAAAKAQRRKRGAA
jgi:hypothetical protein